MERVSTLFSICLLWLNVTFGQDCLYENYFKLVGAAYADFASSRFEEAAENYKVAFESVDFSFGADLQYALEVARHTQDSTWAFEVATMLAKGGIPIQYFKDYEHYAWFNQFRNDYPDYTAYYDRQFDRVAREKFLELCLSDYTFNETYHKWCSGEIEMTLPELIGGATGVLDSLKAIIHDHGFPSEQVMGYYYQNGEIKMYPITPLFIHIYQRGELFYADRLLNISCDGKLRPVDAFDVARFRGFGDSTGIEQEMKIRWQRCRGSKD